MQYFMFLVRCEVIYYISKRTILCAHSRERYTVMHKIYWNQWSSIKFVVYEHLEQHEKHLLSTKSCNANQVVYIEGQGILQTIVSKNLLFLF